MPYGAYVAATRATPSGSSVYVRRSAILKPIVIASVTPVCRCLHLPTDLDQNLTRADHRFANGCLRVRPQRQVRMGQQDLGRQQ